MYTEQKARELVIEAGLRLVEEKLIARTWGNISARVSEEEFIITPSGMAYETLKPEDLVKVRIDDLSYEGTIKPSSEKGIHAESYRQRKDVDFIIHTHQFYASAIAAECRSTGVAPCAKYALPGTKKMVKCISAVLKQNPDDKVFLMARHGTLILGADLSETFERAEKLEADAEALFRTRVAAGVGLSQDASQDPGDAERLERYRALAKKYEHVSISRDPYVMACCRLGKRLKPYIDDFAMIAGADVLCVDDDPRKIRRALSGRNAVLIKGVGALCTGKTADDVEAVEMIVSKNAAASLYVRKARPLSRADAMLERRIYVGKYSKRKDDSSK